MRRALHLSSLILLALTGCARDPAAPPPAGGQSGDDGDVIPDPGGPPIEPGPVPPGVPELPCDPEEAEVELGAATMFGVSSIDLIARLELATPISFHWVPYDAIDGVVFSPGPSETTVTIGLEARAGAVATEKLWHPRREQAGCPEAAVHVPVQLRLHTSDGALEQQIDATLDFSSANTATLDAAFLAEDVAGTFAFDQIGAPEAEWESTGLHIQADFWPGGSRGHISPSFATVADLPATPPSSSPEPVSTPPGSDIAPPRVPSHFGVIALWPRMEACEDDSRGLAAAYASDDTIIGWSLADVVSELDAHASWTLTSGTQSTNVHFSVQAPAGLQCVRARGREMTFDVMATLSAEARAGSPLEHLGATSVFELTARSAKNGAGLEELRWVRRDVVASQTRGAFEAATGITLSAPGEYQRMWWSWHGRDTRETASSPWALHGELVVTSLDAEQSAEIDREVAQGGPGAGIFFESETQFPVLPGDRLIEAEIAP